MPLVVSSRFIVVALDRSNSVETKSVSARVVLVDPVKLIRMTQSVIGRTSIASSTVTDAPVVMVSCAIPMITADWATAGIRYRVVESNATRSPSLMVVLDLTRQRLAIG